MKEVIKSLIMTMAESEEACNSLWNDLIHLDKGSDLLIASVLTEMLLQTKQSIEDTSTIIKETTSIKAELEKQLKYLENFSEKLLTD